MLHDENMSKTQISLICNNDIIYTEMDSREKIDKTIMTMVSKMVQRVGLNKVNREIH